MKAIDSFEDILIKEDLERASREEIENPQSLFIEGFEINYFSDWDKLPVKTHLPEALKGRYKTKKQWMELGYNIKANAIGFDMHPQILSKILITYYLDTDIEKMQPETAPKNCLTCAFRTKKGYCEIAGEYVGEVNRCSEYENRIALAGHSENIQSEAHKQRSDVKHHENLISLFAG